MTNSAKGLREAIDRMVEDSIRRILPAVMNEVLLKTIANANVIQESAPQQPQRAPQKATKAPSRKPSSLSQLLDESAGADFYQDPRTAMAEATQEEQAPPNASMAQRIQSLPPELQSLAEGMVLDDDGGEMWEDAPQGDDAGPLEIASRRAGLDFSRMQRAIQVTEKKKPILDQSDRAAQAKFEEQRLKMMRERLNGGKPVE